MQFAKDSFYAALRERLAALNPSRSVTLNGVPRPALLVVENELPAPAAWLPGTFYLEWKTATVAQTATGAAPLLGMQCTVTYFTSGTVESGVDRGRQLGELDAELLEICQPCHTEKRDFRQLPSIDLGTALFWTLPEFAAAEAGRDDSESHSARLERSATLTVFFFPEATTL